MCLAGVMTFIASGVWTSSTSTRSCGSAESSTVPRQNRDADTLHASSATSCYIPHIYIYTNCMSHRRLHVKQKERPMAINSATRFPSPPPYSFCTPKVCVGRRSFGGAPPLGHLRRPLATQTGANRTPLVIPPGNIE